MNIPLKKIIEEMSLDAVQEVLDVIRKRNDIACLIVTTQKEVEEMDEYYRTHFDELYGIKKKVADEPA